MNKPTSGPWNAQGHGLYKNEDIIGVITAPLEAKMAEGKANARLIVAAVNACFTINPSNPLAVAEAMPELVGAAKGLLAFIHEKFPKDFEPGGNGYLCPHHRAIAAALAKLEAK